MKNRITISFLLISICLIYPQQISNWKFYTDMKNVNDFIISKDGFWSATNGGAFFFNAANDSFTTFRRSEGILGVFLIAICIDNNGKIWFGGSEGTIDVYDPPKNSVHNILDILNSDKTLKQINSFSASGDTIFAATDFGISLINSENYTFYDTFTKFGSLPSNLRINSAAKFDLIYACTDQGIAVQKKGAFNLSVPEAWDIFQTSEGLPSNRIFKVVKYQGSILASTDAGLSAFNGSAWIDFLPELNSVVSDIEVSGDSLFILTGDRIYLYVSGVLAEIYSSGVDLISIEFDLNMGLSAATINGILRTSTGDFIFPNSPQSNKFFNLNVDNESNLWVASGPDGDGLFNYDGGTWLNYNISNTPQLPSNNYFIAYTAPDNTNYFGNWGSGFLRLRNDQIDIFNADNTDLEGTDENPNFLVISGFCTDSKKNLWILNSFSVNRKILSMMTPDSLWYHFSVPAAQNLYLERQLYLVIDQYDTKWYCSQDEHGQKRGLFYFNENKTYDNASDDKSGFLTTSDNLTDNSITAIATDLRGDIWVGTGFGVNIISNQQSILTSTPNLIINEVFSLRQQSINCIAVDPLNQKWIGTNQGLQVVNSDGSRLIASYSTENTPLPTNEIKSIAIDRKTGMIYVGTVLGVASFDTPSIEPQENYSELLLYPNPFILNSKGIQLNIKNLIRDSEIKILTLTGKLVKYLEAETEASPGGDIAFWDGTDTEGNFVSSGIYFVVAFDKEGNNIITGKVAVIKE
jgi:ligand-binding sensor domain-containing protein